MLFVLCVAVLLFVAGFFVLFIVLSLCLVNPIQHCDHLAGKKELVAMLFLVCGLCNVCLGLFAFPIGVIGRLHSVIVALPGHHLYYL